MNTDPRGGPALPVTREADPPSRISRRFPPAVGPLSPAVVSSQIRPASFLSTILVVGTEMPHSIWYSVSLYDLTFHIRNKPRRSSPVAWVAVVEAAFAVGTVHRGKSATSVPVLSVLAGLQPWVADLVPPSPAVVTVLPCLISPVSEPAVPWSKLHAGACLLTLSLARATKVAHYDVTLYWHGRLKSPK